MLHLVDLGGTLGEVGSNLGEDLWGEVDGVTLSSLEEGWGGGVVGEESSGLSEDVTNKLEFFSLLFEFFSLSESFVGALVNDGLEFLSGEVLGLSLSVLLVADWGQGVEDILEV